MYEAKVLADSICEVTGKRLTTFQSTFGRPLLAELNTHRMLSRNSASSRAIPPEKQIERVKHDPWTPEFGGRAKGMVPGSLSEIKKSDAREIYLKAREKPLEAAESLIRLDVDKASINRLLESWLWHTVIISGTEWDNFFSLRCHKDAALEFQIIARKMQEAMLLSEPEPLRPGGWHLPLIDPGSELIEARTRQDLSWPKVSAGRVARVSFDTQNKVEEVGRSLDRANALSESGHWSPFEHPAMCLGTEVASGNFIGWMQLRKLFLNEDNFDALQREVLEAT